MRLIRAQTSLTDGGLKRPVLRGSSVTESAALWIVSRASPRRLSAAAVSPSCAARSAREFKIFQPIVGNGLHARRL
jgi:hypothetical protein